MHSVAIPNGFLFLFFIRSVSVPIPYPFFTCSVSVLHALVSILGTRSEERGFEELIYKNGSKELCENRHLMREYKQTFLFPVKMYIQLFKKYGKMVM